MKTTHRGTFVKLSCLVLGTGVAASSVAQNLVQNGAFDLNAAHWSVSVVPGSGGGAGGSAIFDANSDAHNDPLSGSVRFSAARGFAIFRSECIDLGAQRIFDVGAFSRDVRVMTGALLLNVDFHASGNCSGEATTITALNFGYVVGLPQWQHQAVRLQAPQTTDSPASASVFVMGGGLVGAELWLDDVFFQPVPDPVFVSGFE